MSNNTDRSRRRFITNTGGLALGAGALAALGPLRGALAQGQILQWGSASLGSTGYVIITVLAASVNKFTKLRNSALSTAGGAENMALLGEGVIDFGQTTSTDWQPAIEGKGRYEGSPVKAYQMFSYTVWNCSPMVRADSGINSLEDLAGKKVMPATAGGATTGMWHTLFKTAGLYDKVDWTYGSWSETYGAIKTGAADCIPTLFTNGRPSAVVSELEVAGIPMKVFDLPEGLLKDAQKSNPGLLSAMVEPGKVKFIDKPTRVASFGGILAAHPRVEEETAYQITKAVLDNVDFVTSKGSELQDVSLDFATKFLIPDYPVHPGAARYLKEKGVWRDELTVAS